MNDQIDKPAQRRKELLEHFGPTVSGAALARALGFKSYSTFYKTRQAGKLAVKVFDIPGRRGPFARTTDIADWLETLDDEQQAP